MDFLDMFSFMLRDRYPIFCSVFQTASQNPQDPIFEPPILEQETYEQEYGLEEDQPEASNGYLYNDTFTPESSETQFFEFEDDSVHDLDKINALIERMVISAAANLPKNV